MKETSVQPGGYLLTDIKVLRGYPSPIDRAFCPGPNLRGLVNRVRCDGEHVDFALLPLNQPTELGTKPSISAVFELVLRCEIPRCSAWEPETVCIARKEHK